MDRIHLRCQIDPNAGAAAPWILKLLGNRLEPAFENSQGKALGAGDYEDEPREIFHPFDETQCIRASYDDQLVYDDLCSWLRFNPCFVRTLRISADRPETIKRLSVNVWRRTPFKQFERQWIPLAGLLDQKSENNTSLRLELPMVLDGFTCLEIRANTLPDDVEFFDVILEVEAIDDDRKRLA